MRVLFLLTLCLALGDAAFADSIERKQIVVVDGDTVRIDGIRTRLCCFDTPEIKDVRCDAERERGEKARARLQAILDANESIDVERLKRRDRWNRPLAKLRAGGRDVGEILIAESLAVPYNGRGFKMNWCPRYRVKR
jgi:micrococcal nuclease